MSSYSDVFRNVITKTTTKRNNGLNLFKENARRMNENKNDIKTEMNKADIIHSFIPQDS
ncbi:hypothetical protein [Helicobacter pylori]|uniref:hypothetical protein n=1 Tax=Helicobacter pylori TaxID=210 RepID=UPI0002BB4F43|nr:hypothetical protein [Helicobacter pylori]EMH25948.1 hypothetical protein HMPREF1419_00283 [Helicobacter pylori GAM263BFi]